MTIKKQTAVVIGLGYVGLPLAILLKKKGFNVFGVVRSKEKAKLISKGISPIKDESLIKSLQKFPIKTDVKFDIVSEADFVIICVPTPVKKNYKPDYQPVISASKNLAKFLKNNTVVILESTVNPGTLENIVIPTIEKTSGMKAGLDFYVSHCPERINPGDKKWSLENIPRVVGSLENEGLQKTVTFYEKFISGKITPMKSLKEAEAVKIFENCFRDINIAFVNELAMSFSKLGINTIEVIKGASTKPFAFIPHYPGCGVGGHCIPVDPYYLINYAGKNGFNHEFLQLARNINRKMPKYTVNILKTEVKKLKLKKVKVGILGLSYKNDIDDDRESPAYEIIKELKKAKILFETFDPYLTKKSSTETLNELLEKTDALIITTKHEPFAKLTIKSLEENNIKIIVDGRNCFDGKIFTNSSIKYRGIGV